MQITRTIIFLITAMFVIEVVAVPFRYSSQHYQLKQYQIRRPLQYFFYLLQLKSTFNPMLGGLISMGDHCSSKAGPFCTLAGHQPFQTHSVKLSELNEQQKAIYSAILSQQKQNFLLYDSLIKNQDARFLIRNELTNQFDRILKQKIGDRMHLPDMLPPQYFQEVK